MKSDKYHLNPLLSTISFRMKLFCFYFYWCKHIFSKKYTSQVSCSSGFFFMAHAHTHVTVAQSNIWNVPSPTGTLVPPAVKATPFCSKEPSFCFYPYRLALSILELLIIGPCRVFPYMSHFFYYYYSARSVRITLLLGCVQGTATLKDFFWGLY